jgi:EF hand
LKEFAMKTQLRIAAVVATLFAGVAMAYPPSGFGPGQGQQGQGFGQRQAQGPGQGRGGMMKARGPGAQAGAGLVRADTNQDGVISKEESQTRGPMLQQRFAAGDTNKDGKLDAAEIKALTEDCPARR